MHRKRDTGSPVESPTEVEHLPSAPFTSSINTVFDHSASAGSGRKPWTRGELLDGRYQLEQSIRLHSIAQLFTGTQLAIQRRVVVDVLRPEWARDALVRQELERTALALAAIDHRNVQRVLDLSLAERPYVVMEFVAGRPLLEVIVEDGPLDPTRAVRIAIQLCGALRAVHARGLVHRDVGPANILLCQRDDGGETPKLIGFVFAEPHDTVLDSSYGIDRENDLEFASTIERRADARADVYSLVYVLYQMLTGTADSRRPLDREALHSQVRKRLDRVSTAKLCQVLERGVARAAVRRFQSPGHLEEALRSVVEPASRSRANAWRGKAGTRRFVTISVAAILISGLIAFFCARIQTSDHGRTRISTTERQSR